MINIDVISTENALRWDSPYRIGGKSAKIDPYSGRQQVITRSNANVLLAHEHADQCWSI